MCSFVFMLVEDYVVRRIFGPVRAKVSYKYCISLRLPSLLTWFSSGCPCEYQDGTRHLFYFHPISCCWALSLNNLLVKYRFLNCSLGFVVWSVEVRHTKVWFVVGWEDSSKIPNFVCWPWFYSATQSSIQCDVKDLSFTIQWWCLCGVRFHSFVMWLLRNFILT